MESPPAKKRKSGGGSKKETHAESLKERDSLSAQEYSRHQENVELQWTVAQVALFLRALNVVPKERATALAERLCKDGLNRPGTIEYMEVGMYEYGMRNGLTEREAYGLGFIARGRHGAASVSSDLGHIVS